MEIETPITSLFFLLSLLTLKSSMGQPHLDPKHTPCALPNSSIGNGQCQLHKIQCKNGWKPEIQFPKHGGWYQVAKISYMEKRIKVLAHNFTLPLRFKQPNLPSHCITNESVFSNCKPINGEHGELINCGGNDIYHWTESGPPVPPPDHQKDCWVHRYPNIELGGGFTLLWDLPQECQRSHRVKGKRVQIAIGLATGFGSFLFACILFFFYLRFYRKKQPPCSSSTGFPSNQYSSSDLQNDSTLFMTQFFTYKELQEATNNFDPSQELGDGSFGTVYHGKLRDGRFVAVKRLCENNYMRVEQFMNEIAILSRLKHQNLVTLYGCSSRHDRELLLVYEFIPNGTVADHLHGHGFRTSFLTWPVRMSIAIETADALAYLHAVEIIHHDVKTNNILLDDNFRVKVADFGLSLLLPTNATYITSTPQGTPGYVDPYYHRSYQLTEKSDVYSFGVVLIELISSKTAFDTTRDQDEINLASMAVNKILDGALHELVDPNLGFELDYNVNRMVSLVAELAFRCLNDEKEMRPSMQEVLEVLRGIWGEYYKMKIAEDLDIPINDIILSKKMKSFSSNSANDGSFSTPTAIV